MKSKIILLVATVALWIFFLIDYIKSFGTYDDGGFKGFYFDTDTLILLLIATILVVAAIIQLLGSIKYNPNTKKNTVLTLGVALFISSGYSLFSIVKYFTKAINATYDGEKFEFLYSDIEHYVPWCVISILLFVYLIFEYLKIKKESR